MVWTCIRSVAVGDGHRHWPCGGRWWSSAFQPNTSLFLGSVVSTQEFNPFVFFFLIWTGTWPLSFIWELMDRGPKPKHWVWVPPIKAPTWDWTPLLFISVYYNLRSIPTFSPLIVRLTNIISPLLIEITYQSNVLQWPMRCHWTSLPIVHHSILKWKT